MIPWVAVSLLLHPMCKWLECEVKDIVLMISKESIILLTFGKGNGSEQSYYIESVSEHDASQNTYH